ncbi:hypothetical protein [Exiguobacterium sp.]
MAIIAVNLSESLPFEKKIQDEGKKKGGLSRRESVQSPFFLFTLG